LTAKTPIITGASKAIGRATPSALVQAGLNLGLIARNDDGSQNVTNELKTDAIEIVTATADVGNRSEVDPAAGSRKESLGTLDILINNAGISKFGGFLELEPAEWEEIIQFNLLGAYYMTRAVLPTMIEQQSGDIINISSTAGEKGGPITSAYSASKSGLLGLTESLALEVRKHDIRVTALTPSTVVTDLAING